MKKHFKLTKNSAQIQVLLYLYCNYEDEKDFVGEPQEKLLEKIIDIIMPKAKELLAIKCFNLGKSKDDISIDKFEEFIKDSILIYIEKYDPLYRGGSYGKSANFDTYFFACLDIDLFLGNKTLSKYLNEREIERAKRAEEREKKHQILINSIRLEDKEIIRLSKPIKHYKNIAEVVEKHYKNNEETFLINIKKVLDGRANTSDGYKWIYKENYNTTNN